MTNRNSLLGRARPTERLTKEEKAALDRADHSAGAHTTTGTYTPVG